MPAIVDYETLQTELQSWLWDRDDLIDRIPAFIGMAEAQLNRRLRTRGMVVRATATVDGQYMMLPNDFAGVKTFTLDATPPIQLAFTSPDGLTSMQAAYTLQTGKPQAYAIVGKQFEFFPVPSDGYDAELTYYQRIQPLADNNPTNWLILDHPDAYLYGSLQQAAPWLRDDAMTAIITQGFATIMADIGTDDEAQTNAPNIQILPNSQISE